jgi:glycosyltransferase involved in cell wall biosynthesis
VIVGDGAERQALETLVAERGLAERVTFTGMLGREDLFAEMRQAEVFVFLSMKASERLPNVVMEAMLAEAFCVVSPTDDIDQLIETGVTGEIVDDLDPAVVAKRVLAALDDDARAAVGERAARHIREQFSADALMELYAAGWRQALGRAPSTG